MFLKAERSTPIAVCAVFAASCLLFAAPLRAASVHRKKQIALEQYHKALEMREALNGRPDDQRTVDDYERVIEAFRKVYHVAPTSTRADASVLAVGDLLAQQARLQGSEKGFHSAIEQYQFLAREYPGSKYRFEALFTIGQIYKEDLADEAGAKATFEDFLKKYPRHPLAEDARAALKEMDSDQERQATAERLDVAGDSKTAHPKTELASAKHKNADKEQDEDQSADNDSSVSRRHKLPLVTSIRYWSTPDYTRIAIDLGAEVKYEAGRVPSPERIFFDLHDARLASELVGKSYDVDDGLLKKIRVAQFKPGMARVVLEVNNLAEYSAFLLPNPYRLIIDVHGKKSSAPIQTAKAGSDSDEDSTVPPAVAGGPVGHSNSYTGIPQSTKSKHAEPPAVVSVASEHKEIVTAERRPEPSTEKLAKAQSIAHRTVDVEPQSNLDLTEIASLSSDPDEVKATKHPTSGPVVDKVASREKESAKKENAKTEQLADADVKPLRSSKGSHGPRGKKSASTEDIGHEAAPTADGDLSLIRALGLKIGKIVVDAGHGGHDTGTIGPHGLMEKDLVLDVALRLGKLLENKLGADVIYTRKDDTFIPLETRTAIANQNQADLFISIHANSSRDASARGVETYYLNFTSSADALEVAARENADSETSVFQLQDLVKKIALKDKIDESREFASCVERSLYAGEVAKNRGIRNRGVKKAPFIVLIGANMPSILSEISFVSNPNDERKLRTPEYRQRIAESLYRGIARYAQGLSGIKVADAKPGLAGQ